MTVMPTGQTVKKRSFLCRKISLSLAYLSRHRMNIDILSSISELNVLSVLSRYIDIPVFCSGYDDFYPPPMMGPPRGMPRGGGGGGGGSGMRPRMPPPPNSKFSS